MLLLLYACIPQQANRDSGLIDISDRFLLAITPWESVEAEDILSARVELDFRQLNPPMDISSYGHDSWLKTTLQPAQNLPDARILEVPGQLFDQGKNKNRDAG